MENWTMFVDFILIAGISLLGLNILFLAKSKGQVSQKMLIVFFANAICFLLYYYSYLHRLRYLGAVAVLFGNGVGVLLGPLLLFQLKSLVLHKSQYFAAMVRHLIPFGLLWLFVSVPLALSMVTKSFSGYGNWYVQHEAYFNLPENIYFLVYIVLSFRLLRQIREASRENYSAAGTNDLNWYRHFLIGLTAIVLFDTGCTLYELFFPMIKWNIGTLIAFSFVLLYSYLGYKGMFQSQILIPDFLLERLAIAMPENEAKAALTEANEVAVPKTIPRQLDHYSGDEIEKLKQELFDILENKKLYLNDTLGLSELAEQMGISGKKLSELLNQHLQVSFYSLINQYRVKEVVERLMDADAEKYTLMGIAYDCGFQSKATFNRIFKQKMGCSPSKYRQQLEMQKV